MNPYRAGTIGVTRFADSHIYNKHPEWFVTYNKQILFDPGLPECRQFICSVVKDIVSRYDVDAIHMSYILAVNPAVLSLTGMDKGALFTSTALVSAIATLLLAFMYSPDIRYGY